MVGLRRQQVEHAVAGFRTNAEDALELIGGRVVDGQPPIVEVGDLNEGVRAFDDIGENLPLGERLRHAALQRLVQLAERRFGVLARRHVAGRAEPLGDVAVRIEERHGPRQRPSERAVDSPHAMLQLEHALRRRLRLLNRRRDIRPIVRVNVVAEPRPAGTAGVGDEALPFEGEHLRPVGTHPVERVRAGRHQRAETPFALAQRPLRQHLLRRLRHAQNIPATLPLSSRTGEYENVNQVCSSYPLRFMTSGRSSR